jgi:DNA-binding CsgD family transcriptional regulator
MFVLKEANMKRFTPEQLNHFLDHHAAKPDDHPFYSDLQMRRRDVKHPALPLYDSVSGLPPRVIDYLVNSKVAEDLGALRLHPLELTVAEMRAAGCSLREIARATGVSKWTVEQVLMMVRRRLRSRHHAEQSGAAGWQEVYLAETRRRGR